ncbi:MAG: hypothetical protein C9356_13355 [Oleiphilus sp.]|nr:MAG: hypothetical protein C9356_13355 [Oleiphilus sp.]
MEIPQLVLDGWYCSKSPACFVVKGLLIAIDENFGVRIVRVCLRDSKHFIHITGNDLQRY